MTCATTTIPTRGVPVAKVVSYTKKYDSPARLVGADCPQSQINELSKDFYTYRFSKSEQKKYWKRISSLLENSNVYSDDTLNKSVKDVNKKGIPVYYDDLQYVCARITFNPVLDIVVGVKIS